MQFVEVHDNIFNSAEIEEILNEFKWKKSTGIVNILDEINHLNKLDLIKYLVLAKGHKTPVIAHALNTKCYDFTTKDHKIWEPHNDAEECKIITLLLVFNIILYAIDKLINVLPSPVSANIPIRPFLTAFSIMYF